MSTDPKSAGVPAGATHVCTVEGCGIYYRQISGAAFETVPPAASRIRACRHEHLKPIAEPGPAPTTAAPAEQRNVLLAEAPIRCKCGAYQLQSASQAIAPGTCDRNMHTYWSCAPPTPAPAEQLSGKVVCAKGHVTETPLDEGCHEPSGQFDTVEDGRIELGCGERVRPIAEAGPAPTTAAPAEQPDDVRRRLRAAGSVRGDAVHAVDQDAGIVLGVTRAVCGAENISPTREPWNPESAYACKRCLAKTAHLKPAHAEQLSGKVVCAVLPDEPHPFVAPPADNACVRPRPAEQPGKAADPRPAQPQAPADRWERADNWLVSAVGRYATELERLAAYAEHVAAPLREERDRLARVLEAMRRERNGAQSQRDQERARAETAEKAVAARDARIATLVDAVTKAADTFKDLGFVFRMLRNPKAEEACNLAEKHTRAALGAPEGQPSAPPQELLGKEKGAHEFTPAWFTDVEQSPYCAECGQTAPAHVASLAPSSPEEQLSGKELK